MSKQLQYERERDLSLPLPPPRLSEQGYLDVWMPAPADNTLIHKKIIRNTQKNIPAGENLFYIILQTKRSGASKWCRRNILLIKNLMNSVGYIS